jgi:CheY-like chemotaxis protein
MAPTVLCVIDDRHLCRILEQALQGSGYRVVTAHDGEQALRAFPEAAPALAIVDVALPKRDGFQVLEAVRGLAPPVGRTPVLLVTGGRVTPQYEERAKALGAAALLSKPVPLDQLLDQVKRHARPTRRKGRTSPRREGAGAPLEGNLRHLPFPQLLHHLHGLRATGVLMLGTGKKRKAVQMRDGYPVAVKSNLVNECLGNLLMSRGLLSDEQLQESLDRVKQGEGLQGQILVAMELLTEEEIASALREQAREKFFEIFSWKRGSFRFEIGTRLKRGNELALEGSPANLILAGARRHLPVSRVDAFLRECADRFATRGESPFYRLQEIDLEPGELDVLEGLDGTQRIGDFLCVEEGVRRTLYALIAIEMVDLSEEKGVPLVTEAMGARELPPEGPVPGGDPEQERALRSELAATAERLRGQSYFEMLGVDELADEESIERAYDEAARRAHPDRYHSASAAVRQLAEEVHQLLSRARETLLDPRRRREHELERQLERRRGERKAAEREEGQRALDAEIEFQKGDALLRSRDYENALGSFGRALQQYPEEGEYHAHYGWCLYLCHPDDAGIVQEAIEHVQRGLKLARDREKPYLFLGRLYKAVGKGAAAEKMFTRAIQIRPDCVEALRELRLINLRRQKNRGLIKRIFRR